MKNTLFVCLLVLTILSSCKKDDNSTSQTITPTNVNSTIVTGNWRVTYYYDNNQDETNKFSGYAFNFAANAVVTATNSNSTVTGNWTSGNDDSQVKLILSFSSPANFAEISDDWHVIERTDTRIKLEDVSGGNGGTDYLTFERN